MLMKTNSKFVSNLFKSCGLLMSFVCVAACDNKDDDTNKGDNNKANNGNKTEEKKDNQPKQPTGEENGGNGSH